MPTQAADLTFGPTTRSWTKHPDKNVIVYSAVGKITLIDGTLHTQDFTTIDFIIEKWAKGTHVITPRHKYKMNALISVFC